jgi:uncharacterized phiE125 gp8 family phage protein
MLRTIEQPADLSGAALSEFKSWLGITRPDEDAILVDLLRASMEMCEAFTGQSPIEQTVEERLPALQGHYRLSSLPVKAIVSAEAVDASGARSPIAGADFSFAIDASGSATVTWMRSFGAQHVALRIVAGIAPDWASVPKPLRQGMIRLASFHYRERDHEGASQPPASVTALWRPWRIARLM